MKDAGIQIGCIYVDRADGVGDYRIVDAAVALGRHRY